MAARVLAAVVFCAVGTLLVLGQDLDPVFDTLYGEDGRIFLGAALDLPAGESIIRSYNGYLHVYPRLLGEVASLLPLRDAPLFMAVAAALTTAVVALFVYIASATWLTSRVVRGALATAVLLHPTALRDTYNAVSGVHWFLAFGALCALLWRPQRVVGAVFSAVLVTLAALSSPVMIVLLPLALARLVTRRPGREWLAPIAALIGASLQLWQVLTLLKPASPTATTVGGVLELYAQRVATPALIGQLATERVWPAAGMALPVIACVLTLGVLVAGLARASSRARLLALGGLCLSLALFGLMIRVRGHAATMAFTPEEVKWTNDRYTIVPLLVLYSAVAVAIDALLARRGRVVAGLLAACACVALLGVAASNFLTVTEQVTSSWSSELQQGSRDCVIAPVSQVRLLGHPGPGRSRWAVTVPCDRLLRD